LVLSATTEDVDAFMQMYEGHAVRRPRIGASASTSTSRTPKAKHQ
jgi:hypothetical protein